MLKSVCNTDGGRVINELGGKEKSSRKKVVMFVEKFQEVLVCGTHSSMIWKYKEQITMKGKNVHLIDVTRWIVVLFASQKTEIVLLIARWLIIIIRFCVSLPSELVTLPIRIKVQQILHKLTENLYVLRISGC